MACRRRIKGATRSGPRLVMSRLIPKPSLGLFFAARGISGTTNNSDECCREVTPYPTARPDLMPHRMRTGDHEHARWLPPSGAAGRGSSVDNS